METNEANKVIESIKNSKRMQELKSMAQTLSIVHKIDYQEVWFKLQNFVFRGDLKAFELIGIYADEKSISHFAFTEKREIFFKGESVSDVDKAIARFEYLKAYINNPTLIMPIIARSHSRLHENYIAALGMIKSNDSEEFIIIE